MASGRNDAGCSRNDSAANRENEEESADKFRNVFSHFSFWIGEGSDQIA